MRHGDPVPPVCWHISAVFAVACMHQRAAGAAREAIAACKLEEDVLRNILGRQDGFSKASGFRTRARAFGSETAALDRDHLA